MSQTCQLHWRLSHELQLHCLVQPSVCDTNKHHKLAFWTTKWVKFTRHYKKSLNHQKAVVSKPCIFIWKANCTCYYYQSVYTTHLSLSASHVSSLSGMDCGLKQCSMSTRQALGQLIWQKAAADELLQALHQWWEYDLWLHHQATPTCEPYILTSITLNTFMT